MEKKTAGQIATELAAKNDGKQSVIDTQREIDKEYINEVKKCIEAHSHFVEPFYIVVILKKEKLLSNVMRRYFLARASLPTPDWDQQVWRYDPKTGDLTFLWVLPDRNTAMWLVNDIKTIPLEFTQLVEFVLDFLDHKLYNRFLTQEKKEEDQEGLYKEQLEVIKEFKREEKDEKSSDVKHGGTIIH